MRNLVIILVVSHLLKSLSSLPVSPVSCPSMLQQSNDLHMEMTYARNIAKKY